MRFEKIIEKAVENEKLYPDADFILKVVQLGELLVIVYSLWAHQVLVNLHPGRFYQKLKLLTARKPQ
jgi:hypothetical protein